MYLTQHTFYLFINSNRIKHTPFNTFIFNQFVAYAAAKNDTQQKPYMHWLVVSLCQLKQSAVQLSLLIRVVQPNWSNSVSSFFFLYLQTYFLFLFSSPLSSFLSHFFLLSIPDINKNDWYDVDLSLFLFLTYSTSYIPGYNKNDWYNVKLSL